MKGENGMIIDYLGHSGFLVETERQLLLFDAERFDPALIEGRPVEKPLFVFVSHAHPDHFNPEIFSLADGRRAVRYLLSFDLKGNPSIPAGEDAVYLDAGQIREIDGLGRVETLLSNDEGVAFLIDTGAETVFHAGDLNWWDWEGEDPAWLREHERVFLEETAKLAGREIDAAFLVLDDRLGDRFSKGVLRILSVCRPRFVLPMHFWQDRTVVGRLRAMLPDKNAAVILDTANETKWEIN